MTVVNRTLDSLEIVGGALCLNFANTLNSRLTPEHDYLITFSDLAAWANKVGVLSGEQMTSLQQQAKKAPENANRALQDARHLREFLYALFSGFVRQVDPPEAHLDAFTRLWGEAIAHSHLTKSAQRYTIAWEIDRACEAIRWPIIHSAGELIVSGELGHIKECPGCGWLFLDLSKNQSRRWCSMNTCGVSDKMRRYYRKSQQGT